MSPLTVIAPTTSSIDAAESAHRNMNALRLMLASMVIISHAYEMVDGSRIREPLTWIVGTVSLGDLAVNGFFLLSGHLISGSYQRQQSAFAFLRNRILRIFPGFLACALLSATLVGSFSGGREFLRQIDLTAFLTGLPFLLLRGLPAALVDLPIPAINGPLWSLRPEFQCYLLVLALGVVGLLRHRWVWLMVGATFLAAHLLHVQGIALRIPGTGGDTYREFFRVGLFFAAGGYLSQTRPSDSGTVPFRKSTAAIALMILLPCLFFPLLVNLALATLGVYATMWLVFRTSPIAPWLAAVPDISYGTYLYGWPIEQILLRWLGPVHPIILWMLALPMAWLIGLLSWHLIESPALQLKAHMLAPGPSHARVSRQRCLAAQSKPTVCECSATSPPLLRRGGRDGPAGHADPISPAPDGRRCGRP
jgi:peptidoglycan/LPS O-acetylase OafA/YrhL